jgi:hypothetical protein
MGTVVARVTRPNGRQDPPDAATGRDWWRPERPNRAGERLTPCGSCPRIGGLLKCISAPCCSPALTKTGPILCTKMLPVFRPGQGWSGPVGFWSSSGHVLKLSTNPQVRPVEFARANKKDGAPGRCKPILGGSFWLAQPGAFRLALKDVGPRVLSVQASLKVGADTETGCPDWTAGECLHFRSASRRPAASCRGLSASTWRFRRDESMLCGSYPAAT